MVLWHLTLGLSDGAAQHPKGVRTHCSCLLCPLAVAANVRNVMHFVSSTEGLGFGCVTDELAISWLIVWQVLSIVMN